MEKWDGVERRRCNAEYCSSHLTMLADVGDIKTDVAVTAVTIKNLSERINGSMASIEKHVNEGNAWRMGMIGLCGMIIIQTIILASMWGRLNRTVEINTRRLDIIEEEHRTHINGKLP